MTLREEHPRPRLTRSAWIDLGGEWGFAFDDRDQGMIEGWSDRPDVFDRTITVPFPPESPASGINDKAPHRVVWYRRVFRVPVPEPDQTWLLHFGAVDYRAHVWVNGRLAATHEGGNTPFSADITALLRHEGEENEVVVRVEDDPDDLTQPRGKQYWKRDPGDIWYHRTTGVWQPVWLEPVNHTHIVDVRFTTDLESGRIGLTVTLNHNPDRPLRLRVKMALCDRQFANDEYGIVAQETIRQIGFDVPGVTIDRQALFWSPEFPNLVDVEMKLLDPSRGPEPIDVVESYLGIRSVSARDGYFFLNGRPYYLRLALAQGYWPETHLSAPSGDAIRNEVELARAHGFNGLRLHQKVEDPRYLYWCDRIGLLVWGEMANAYTFSTFAVERFTREWIDVVRRDVSHPCLVAWVPFNESWGVPNLERDPVQRHYVQAIYHLTHALDPSRPVIGNDGWELFASDIWGIHDYALEPDTITARYGSEEAVARSLRSVRPYFQALTFPEQGWSGQPVMLTEVGGIDFVPNDEPDAPQHARRAVDPDEFLARFEALMDAIFACPTVRGFCYTQLCDTEQERSGLLTSDRMPKFNSTVIRQILNRPA